MLTWHHMVMLWHLEVLDPPDPPKRLDTHYRASLDVYWHRARLGLVSNRKEMTEEEWLEKERKEIQEVEKTVTIRFANYSTLMRAQTLT